MKFTKIGLATKHKEEFIPMIKRIEAATGLILMARNKDDVVNGYVSACDDDVEVVIYDKDEAPNNEHKTTFKKPTKLPTKSEIKAVI